MISNEKNLALDNTTAFKEIMEIIGRTRERVFRLVNRELIDLYCEIGRYISEKLSALLREISWTILCVGKDDELVEYALSRSMSPALIAEYQTHLPQKALLENKLCELRELAEAEGLADDDEDDGGTE